MLDVNLRKKQQEAEKQEAAKQKPEGKGFFGFIRDKMCGTSESEREAEALTESMRPVKKSKASDTETSRDTETK